MSGNLEITKCIKYIEARNLATGGFAERLNGSWRPDSTAWAILAMEAAGIRADLIDGGRASLVVNQLQDGRVCLPEAPNVIWPTSLAILAWREDRQYVEAQNRAVNSLLNTIGNHWNKNPKAPVEHDTSIPGWPWVIGMHSFLEPTAMSLLALERTRQDSHQRFQEGIRMLMNRRLPHGGWNYGNTRVYGNDLLPHIDTTGIAITALAGHTSEESVKNSLQYLRAGAENCRTPLSLGWALFGLGAWEIFPGESEMWIEKTLIRQETLGSYGTSLLSLLALAFFRGGDFRK